jgi:hypothetical protein
MPLLSNRTSSEVTQRDKCRVIYSRYVVTKRLFNGGCGPPPRIIGGSGLGGMGLQASAYHDVLKGAALIEDECCAEINNVSCELPIDSSAQPAPPEPVSNAGVPLWASTYGITGATSFEGMATDKLGNTYILGTFREPIQVNSFSYKVPNTLPIITSLFGTLIPSGDLVDTFLIKYNSDGQVQWATNVGNAYSPAGNNIAVDTNGDVFITGYIALDYSIFNSFDVVNPGIDKNISTSLYGFIDNDYFGINTAYYVAKYSGDAGQAQWVSVGYVDFVPMPAELFTARSARSAQRSSVYGTGNERPCVTADKTGNVYFTCTTGAYIVCQYGGILDPSSNIITQIQIGRNFNYSADPSSGTHEVPYIGTTFIVKYNGSDGAFNWVTDIVNTNRDVPGERITNSVTCDADGNAYMTGYYNGDTELRLRYYSGVQDEVFQYGDSGIVSKEGETSAFVAKCDPNGSFTWVATITGMEVEGTDIAIDSYGDIYVAVESSSTSVISNGVHLDGNNIPPAELYGMTDVSVMLVKYSNIGIVQWIETVNPATHAYSVAIDSNNNIFLTGNFSFMPVALSSGPTTVSEYYQIETQFYGLLNIATDYSIYLIRYNSDGFIQWATTIESTTTDYDMAISLDDNGSLYIGGSYDMTPLRLYGYDPKWVTADYVNTYAFGTLNNPILDTKNGFIAKYNIYDTTNNGDLSYI